MILVADSGGSKTDWICGSGSGFTHIQTQGLNPNICSPEEIRQVLREKIMPWLDGKTIIQLYFYGAGLTEADQESNVQSLLQEELSLQEVHLGTDLEAAAMAAFGWEPGIIGILGTGSVAFCYDGRDVVQRLGGLGYILEDEGSGVSLGQKWIKHYLQGNLGDTIASEYQSYLGLSHKQLMAKIYQKGNYVSFFAEQTHFLKKWENDPEVREFLRGQLKRFWDENLVLLEGFGEYRVVWMGGVSRTFWGVLNELSKEYNCASELFDSAPAQALYEHILKFGAKKE